MNLKIKPISLTREENHKLTLWIRKYNKQRIRNGQPVYENYEDALRDFLIRKITDCCRSASYSDARQVMRRFVDLTEEKQKRIKDIMEEPNGDGGSVGEGTVDAPGREGRPNLSTSETE